MNSFQIAILSLIVANDGKYSWYQLDRALTGRGVDPGMVSRDLMPTLRELEQGGFITTINGHSPAQPLYSITPAGQQKVEARQAREKQTGPGQV